VLVAEDGSEVVAFALATSDRKAFDDFVKPRVLLVLLLALLRRPGLLPPFIGSVLESEVQPPLPAELMLLAVRQDRRRSSYASDLLEELEGAWQRAGVTRYRVSVRSELLAALEFYRARRFVFEQERRVLGRPMTYLVKDLADRTGAAAVP
jgi:ribosomal protein S18 acetylase RimI-like enzyme